MAEWIDFAALCVSGGAFFATWRTIKADDRSRRLAVRPKLSFYREASGPTQTVLLKMKSSGLGPAVISEYILLFDGKPLACRDEEDAQLVSNALGVELIRPYLLGYISPGSCLAVGDELPIVRFTVKQASGKSVDVHAMAKRFDVVVKHRSFYGDELFTDTSVDSLF
ncbi:hypothetical protein HIV01_004220 [Lysobacter arenosi]|uniref:Uncharacterized protein n=1 Tax=Lysobacter arenosi TaxID=2795387 RepID=A0ABX7REC5_9GAMM|nr:hypothetical protein [Lysobacter arenosi]QSX75737.1 hypothetical protein HIV01_004220 [Lysobacter arenosi]